MPRAIEERWVGIGYDVVTEHLPIGDDQGRLIHDEHGLPKTVEHTTLVIFLPLPDGQRVIRIPFAPEARQELVRKLTGGIVIANGHPPA